MHVLITPDKFKGTLPAQAAAVAIARGWRQIRPDDQLTLLPMTDGGDGFGSVLRSLLRAKTFTTMTTDAAGRPCRAQWWWVENRRLAIVEAAQSNGLALLPKGRFTPLDLDTLGVAPLIRAALKKGAQQCLVGVGGSATNDGGFGLARGLGWSFLDAQDQPLLQWTDLQRLHRLVPPENPPSPCAFTVATDVDNPLLGPQGATRVYGPQKGLDPQDMRTAEACLRRLASITRKSLAIDSSTPGSGAAGGLGFGLRAFLGAKRRLGFDVFAEFAQLDSQLKAADLVITGEGAFDRQSIMGKGVGQWIQRCASLKKPVVILAGRIAPGTAKASPAIHWAQGLCDITSLDQALQNPAQWLKSLAQNAALAWNRSARK